MKRKHSLWPTAPLQWRRAPLGDAPASRCSGRLHRAALAVSSSSTYCCLQPLYAGLPSFFLISRFLYSVKCKSFFYRRYRALGCPTQSNSSMDWFFFHSAPPPSDQWRHKISLHVQSCVQNREICYWLLLTSECVVSCDLDLHHNTFNSTQCFEWRF